jgi:hypothetical protein
MDWYLRDKISLQTETKKDWYGLDFVYVRDHPNSLFHRTFLHAEYPHNFLDFMSPDAFEHQLGYIKNFYQRTDEDVQAAYVREYKYLPKVQMDAFVDETVQILLRIHELLWEQRIDTNDCRTMMEII